MSDDLITTQTIATMREYRATHTLPDACDIYRATHQTNALYEDILVYPVTPDLADQEISCRLRSLTGEEIVLFGERGIKASAMLTLPHDIDITVEDKVFCLDLFWRITYVPPVSAWTLARWIVVIEET